MPGVERQAVRSEGSRAVGRLSREAPRSSDAELVFSELRKLSGFSLLALALDARLGELFTDAFEQSRRRDSVERGNADRARLRFEARDLFCGDAIDLVVDPQARCPIEVQTAQDLCRRLQVLLLLWIGCIDHFEKQIRLGRLLEGGAEGGEQILGHLTDEA